MTFIVNKPIIMTQIMDSNGYPYDLTPKMNQWWNQGSSGFKVLLSWHMPILFSPLVLSFCTMAMLISPSSGMVRFVAQV